jgi:hypothetical protein
MSSLEPFLSFLHGGEKKRMTTDSLQATTSAKAPVIFTLTNQLMTPLLRSPLHGIASHTLVLLSFQGRKSGNTYTFPTGYTQQGNQVEIVSSRSWWKNLRGNARVTLWLKGKQRSGEASVFYGDETVVQALLPLARRSPQMRKLYHIELDEQGQPKEESVRRAARVTALVRIHLDP